MPTQDEILADFEKVVDNDGHRFDSVADLTPGHLHDRLLRFFLLGLGYGIGSIPPKNNKESTIEAH